MLKRLFRPLPRNLSVKSLSEVIIRMHSWQQLPSLLPPILPPGCHAGQSFPISPDDRSGSVYFIVEFLHRFDHQALHCASLPLSLLPFGPFSFPFRVPLRCKFALIIFCFQILGSGRAELGVERDAPTQKGMYIFHIAPDSFQSYDARLSGSGRNFSDAPTRPSSLSHFNWVYDKNRS